MKFFRRLFRMERYFLITYKYQLEDGTNGDGSISISTLHGRHPSIAFVKDETAKKVDGKIDTFFLTNILEFSQEDYYDINI